MSFSFSAVGTRDEVVQQLELSDVAVGAGTYVREALIRALREDSNKAYTGFELRWLVSVSGHSGIGAPVSIQVEVRPLWVPKADTTK